MTPLDLLLIVVTALAGVLLLVGLELLVKNSKGAVVGELRQKAKGSTLRDAVENGLEDMAKSMSNGK